MKIKNEYPSALNEDRTLNENNFFVINNLLSKAPLPIGFYE